MARKKKEETAIPEASVQGTSQEAAETPQESAAAETGKDTTPATETPQGQPVAAVEAATNTPEDFTPYLARVTSGLLVFRRQPDGQPVGTLRRGTEVRVVERAGEFARLDNGIFVKEAFLSPV